MKIAMFTTAHPLDDVRVYSKFARSLIDGGHSISWIGPEKSYFSGDEFRDPRIQYNLYGSASGRRGRLLNIPRAAVRLARHRGSQLIYCPDPDSAALAVLLRVLHKGEVVFDIHEEYHTGMLSRWLGEPLGRVAGQLLVRGMRYVASGSALIVGVNDAVISPYAGHAKSHMVVKNSAPEWFSKEASGAKTISSRLRLFHGKASPANGTIEILRAIRKVPAGVEVLMMPSPRNAADTPYMADFGEFLASSGVQERVVLSDSVPHSEVPDIMDSCQVGLIGYGRELGRASLPNRLFEYMARGLPVLAPTYSPLIREILEKYKIGITRDFEDPDSIADGVRWFLDNPQEMRLMGERARLVFLQEFSWESEFSGFSDWVESLMGEISVVG